MSVIGVLQAILRFDTEQAQNSVQSFEGIIRGKLTNSLRGMAGQAGVAGETLAAMGGSALVAGAGIGAVALAAGYSLNALQEMGGRLTDLSRTSRIATDALQRMEAFGRPLGMSLESMTMASRKLDQALGGGGKNAKGVAGALGALGLNLQELQRMTVDERLRTVQIALSEMDDPLKQAAYGSALLGKAWFQMRMDPENIKEGNEAIENTLTLSTEGVAAGDALGDAWDLLAVNFKTLMAEAAVPLAIELTKLLDLLSSLAKNWSVVIDWTESNLPGWLNDALDAVKGGPAAMVYRGGKAAVGAVSETMGEDVEDTWARISESWQKHGEEISAANAAILAQGIATKEAEAAAEEAVKRKHRVENMKAQAEANAEAIKAEVAQQKKWADMRIKAEFELQAALVKQYNSVWEAARAAATGGAAAQTALRTGADTAGMAASTAAAAAADVRASAEERAAANAQAAADAEAAESARRFSVTIQDAASMLDMFGETLGAIGQDIMKGFAIGDMVKGLMEDLGLALEGAVGLIGAGIAALVAAYGATGEGSTGSRVARGAMSGAAAGAQVAGPWGAVVGAAAGAIMGWVRGSKMDKYEKDIETEFGVPLSRALAEQIKAAADEGVNAATFLAEMYTEAFASGEGDVENFAEEIGDLFSRYSRGEIDKGELETEMGQTIPMLLEQWDELGVEGLASVDRIIDAAKQAGVVTEELLQLERRRLGIVEATAEAFMGLGLTAEQVAALETETGKNIESEVERDAREAGVSADLYEAVAKAAGLEDATKLEELLEMLGMSFDEFAKTQAAELTPEEQAALAARTPEEVAAAEAAAAERQAAEENIALNTADTAGYTRDMVRLFAEFPRAVRDAVAAANG